MKPITFILDYGGIPASFDCMWMFQNIMHCAKISGFAKPKIMFDGDRFAFGGGGGHAHFFEPVVKNIMIMLGLEEVCVPEGQEIRWNMPYNPSGCDGYYRSTGEYPIECTARHARAFEHASARLVDCVTITLRQCGHFPERNSNLKEWLVAAKILANRGEHVVFVPDSVNLKPFNDREHGFEIHERSAMNLVTRADLYGKAKANLFINNGPVVIPMVNPKIPYLHIVPRASVEQFERQHRVFSVMKFNDGQSLEGSPWLSWFGFEKGALGPSYRGPRQLWRWEEDTAENIIRGFEEITQSKN